MKTGRTLASTPAITGEVGDFYVEAECCLMCGVPDTIAPEVFEMGERHCSVKRQPCSDDEVSRTIRAMWSSEAECIRYRGSDPVLLERLARAGMAAQVDAPSRLDTPVRFRDQVSFGISADLPTSAILIASALRADLRASGKRVLPALFGPRSVWVSWFQNRFHLVRLADNEGGRIVARLRSRTALHGLAWLVDDWLRTRNAENIRWETTGDPMSASPDPM